ncbi:MAG: diguanylate cyclase [Rhodocyclales bacterium]|nr:diguanylate cyclase [Rhodocyclales bacterium]
MRLFRNIPLRSKLTLIIMMTCGIALALGATALAVRYTAAAQDNLAQHIAILTKIVATNSTSALAFRDAESAGQTLAALNADPGVIAADIYDAHGKLFASFHARSGLGRKSSGTKEYLDPHEATRDSPKRYGLLLAAETLRISRPIVLDDERIGTIVLEADIEPLRASLLIDAFVMVLIVMTAGLIALLFASQLQKVISEPISRLADSMKHVSTVKDYSQRVRSTGDDELGALIGGFNEMLDQIELRDEQLQRSREQLMTAQHIAQLGNWEWNSENGHVLLSEEACKVFCIPGESSSLTFTSFLDRVHEADRTWVRNALVATLSGGAVLDIEYRIVTDDGATRYVHQLGRACAASTHSRFEGTIQNVTDRAKAEEDLRVAAKALENTVDSVIVMAPDRQIVWVNTAFTLMTGYAREEILGKHPELLKSDRHPAAFYEDIWAQVVALGQWQGEVWSRRKNGEIYPQRLSISQIKDPAGHVSHFVSVSNDISEYKQYETRLEFLAHHDTLTQLANRGQFEARLREAVARASRYGTKGGVMFVDLDHFKAVNDSFGHATGDQLLRAAAARIRQCVRENDTVARLGGDEFAILLDGLSSTPSAMKIADNLVTVLASSFNIAGHTLSISASIGISCYPDDGIDADTLLLNADLAMYRIKEEGRNGYRFFSSEMTKGTAEKPVVPESHAAASE